MRVETLNAERDNLFQNLAARSHFSDAKRAAESQDGQHHVSGLLVSIQHALHLDKSYDDDELDPVKLLRFQVGFSFEDILGEYVFANAGRPESLISLGTLEQDGILLTPDDFDVDTFEILEYKATWSSSRKPIADRWYWLSQMKCYSHVLGADSAKLKVLYVNGNWRPPVPDIQIYRLRWEEGECAQAWAMLLKHREWLQKKEQCQ